MIMLLLFWQMHSDTVQSVSHSVLSLFEPYLLHSVKKNETCYHESPRKEKCLLILHREQLFRLLTKHLGVFLLL